MFKFKKNLILIILVISVLFAFVGCGKKIIPAPEKNDTTESVENTEDIDNNDNNDEQTPEGYENLALIPNLPVEPFKEHYESMNGKFIYDDKPPVMEISIEDDSYIVPIPLMQVIFNLRNDDPFFIFFGDELCPWCRKVSESVAKATVETQTQLFYYDCWTIDEDTGYPQENLRNSLTYDTNSRQVIETYSKFATCPLCYKEILDKIPFDIKDWFAFEGSDGASYTSDYQRIYIPSIYFVKNGEIVDKLDFGDEESDDYPVYKNIIDFFNKYKNF